MILGRPDGARLYWTCAAGAPTAPPGRDLVLSHGLFGDHRLFELVHDALIRAGHRVVRWDLRGHGRSSRGRERVAFDTLVDDLRAVLAASRVHRPVLVGHELGGQLSLALAAAAPDRVAALSLWSTDASASPLAQRVGSAAVAAARHFSVRPITLALEPFWVSRAHGHDAPGVALQRRISSTLSAGALVEVIAADRPDLRTLARDVDLPALVLWGERDRLSRSSAGRELLTALPRAEGGSLPEAAHLIHLDRPGLVVDQLLGWLERI